MARKAAVGGLHEAARAGEGDGLTHGAGIACDLLTRVASTPVTR